MKHRPSLKVILLILVLLVMVEQVSQPLVLWDERLVPVGGVVQACNPKRNRERWARRWRRGRRCHRGSQRSAHLILWPTCASSEAGSTG